MFGRSRARDTIRNSIKAGYLARSRRRGFTIGIWLSLALRHARPDSINTAWRNASFRGFADYMQTPEFEKALNQLIHLSQKRRTAIM